MTTLWAHQASAVELLAPRGNGLLAFDVGTGKTLTALELIRRWGCRRVLICAPLNVVPVWPKEFAKHGLDDWRVLPLAKRTTKKRAEALQIASLCAEADETPFAAVINYDALLGKELAATIQDTAWDCLVIDESQNVKAPGGKASFFLGQLARKIPHRLALTGTPLHDTPLDAYAQMRVVDPRVLGYSWKEFRKRYAVTIEEDLRSHIEEHGHRQLAKLNALQPPVDWNDSDTVVKFGERLLKAREAGSVESTLRTVEELGERYVDWRLKKAPFMRDAVASYRNLDDLSARLSTAMCVARKGEVLDLPPTMHVNRYCTLGDKARSAYNSVEKLLRADVAGGTVTAANVLSRSVRLAQIANGFSVDSETGKTLELGTEKRDALTDFLADLSPSEQVAVFGNYHHDLDAIHHAAKACGRSSCELSGSRKQLPEWQAGEYNVIAVQYQSGGAGVDFTCAAYQCHFAHPWSLGDYEQALGRIDRAGQTRPVTYVHFIASETVDEQIMDALESKSSIAQAVMGRVGTGAVHGGEGPSVETRLVPGSRQAAMAL